MELWTFFATLAVLSACIVISARNPVHSVLFLILVFFNVSGLLLCANLEFFALIFLIVYVGAIAVLFLFVVIILNVRLAELRENSLRYLPIAVLIGILFFFQVFSLLSQDLIPPSNSFLQPNIHEWWVSLHTDLNIISLGVLLYTFYLYPFLIAGLILLVAIIGAIVLTLTKGSAVKRQTIVEQTIRDFRQTVHKVRSV